MTALAIPVLRIRSESPTDWSLNIFPASLEFLRFIAGDKTDFGSTMKLSLTSPPGCISNSRDAVIPVIRFPHEGVEFPAVVHELFDIDVGKDERRFHRYKRIPAKCCHLRQIIAWPLKNNVGRRFALTGRAIDITGITPCRLLADKLASVVGFCHRFRCSPTGLRSRLAPRRGVPCARGDRHPEVLAELDSDGQLGIHVF